MTKQQITRTDLLVLAARSRVVDAAVLESHGITRSVQARLIRTELLQRLAPVLFVVGAPDWLAHVDAAVRIGGATAAAFYPTGSAAAYGVTALALFGIGEQRLPAHVIVPDPAHPTPRSWAVFHRMHTGSRRILDLDIPRVALDDSVIDALGQLDELDAIALVTRVVQERRTTAARLMNVVQARSRVAHHEVIDKILRDGAGIESALEYTFAERVEVAHGLERMDRQFIVPETGHRADGAYPERRTLIHLDGARYHDPEIDRALDNDHGKLKYISFRFGWADCWSQPCRTAAVLADGPLPRRCRRCTAYTGA